MKKQVKIEGLDCPNCARNLASEINKIDGVQNADINFVKSTLSFESDNIEKALEEIVSLTKELEPQAKIVDKQKEQRNKLFLICDISFLFLGIALGFILFFVKMPLALYWSLYVVSALLLGWKTYLKAIRLLFRRIINENLLITISVIGATFVSEHMEGLMVIALYSIGKIFESLAVNRSRKSIEQLARMQPEYANLLVGGEEVRVSPEEVSVGNKIVVKPGEKVPLDGKIVKGSASLNLQSLTGESVPVLKKKGDEILSGSIVLDGELVISVSSAYEDSTISKIMNLVENASENKSKTETFISKITRWYTLGVVVLAVLVWGIVWAVSRNFNDAIYRGLIFLVVSCPCAFAISVPLSYFSGLGNASKNGILIKGSNFLDACAGIDMVAFDKTGTLTTGEFKIEKITALKGKTEDEVLFLSAIGEKTSIHPLAKAIVSACQKRIPKAKEAKEIIGKGVAFEYKNKKYFVGRKSKELKNTAVELYENDVKVGQIDLVDTIKDSAVVACQSLKQIGVKTVLLSGDNQESVQSVAKNLGLDEAYSKLLPQDKFDFIEKAKAEKRHVGYVGDGINDAPSLTLANVGFSMGINGSPASIEASDVVLVDDNPSKIYTSIKISRFTRKIVWENIILSAIVKVVFLSLGAAGITGMLSAVFADVGVTVLAILNSIRALHYKAK